MHKKLFVKIGGEIKGKSVSILIFKNHLESTIKLVAFITGVIMISMLLKPYFMVECFIVFISENNKMLIKKQDLHIISSEFILALTLSTKCNVSVLLQIFYV